MIYKPRQNDLYQTPPKRCCRFFIDNKHCFLRDNDNACISPNSRTVIGFWNGKVGKESAFYTEEQEVTFTVKEQPSPPSPPSQPSPTSKSQKSKMNSIAKPHFVSDAQRARIASEPVALLREKIAKQYGMMVKKN